MKIIVIHSPYGCETGCCGHIVQNDEGEEQFYFDHPYGEDVQEWAKGMVEKKFGTEHCKDLDWDNCIILDDC